MDDAYRDFAGCGMSFLVHIDRRKFGLSSSKGVNDALDSLIRDSFPPTTTNDAPVEQSN